MNKYFFKANDFLVEVDLSKQVLFAEVAKKIIWDTDTSDEFSIEDENDAEFPFGKPNHSVLL